MKFFDIFENRQNRLLAFFDAAVTIFFCAHIGRCFSLVCMYRTLPTSIGSTNFSTPFA